MAVYIDSASRVLVQGMTGAEGTKHTALMLAAGTQIVGGVNPRKAGTTQRFPLPAGDPRGPEIEIPVFGSVAEAKAATGADVSVLFVPPAHTRAAATEAIEAGIPLLIIITEGVPIADTSEVYALAQERGVKLLGPNCPGIISPGKANVGIIPATIAGPGPIGLLSKSGTLTYQMMYELRDIGFSSAVGIGGDPVLGLRNVDVLEAFEQDPETRLIVMIGEIGGRAEERAAEYIAEHVTKPVVAYVAGFTAPEGRTMGHAGAIVSGGTGTAQAKKEALEAVGVRVGMTPTETAELARELLA